MGRVYHDLGDPDGAAEAYEKALGIVGDDRETRLALIRSLLNKHDFDRAAPWVSRALRDRPEDSRVLALAALQAREAGRGDEATDLAERALALDPDNLDATMIRAKDRLLEGDPEAALADLERAIATSPNDVGALQLLAQVEARLGLTERAVKTAERHRQAMDRAVKIGRLVDEINLHPDDPSPRFELGRAAAEGGSTLLATRCFQAALTLDPSFQAARAALAALPSLAPNGAAIEK
jgi:tetratricopeptide (TPR) repeat protein